MDNLLKKMLMSSGVSGYEKEIAGIMKEELSKSCDEVTIDGFGNVIARKGKGGKKIMLAAHMDEIGLVVKYISKEGFLNFVKIGGIDDRVLAGQRVIVKSKKGDVFGILGMKPPHLQKDEDKKKPIRYEDMFIDIGSKTKEDAMKRVAIGDAVVFEPNAGDLNGNLMYGKAADNRIGCYALLKIMEKIKAGAEVYAVATVQEEVGLKGAKTAAFRIAPDFALAIDTNVAGDTPQIKETESALKLGEGVGITTIEASGRGTMVCEKVKELIIGAAEKNKIKHQIDIIEGGVTDGAMISLNREGVLTGVLSIPTRYVHSASAVFSMDDINSAVELAVKVVEESAK